MSKIQHQIVTQGFEVIKTKIAAILVDELSSQYSMGNDQALNVSEIFVDRITPINHTECPVVNVCFADNEYIRATQISQNVVSIFHIDFYTVSKNSLTNNSDKLSARNLSRLMHVVQNILMHPVYNRLELSGIENVNVKKMSVADPLNTQDANSMQLGRLIVEVKNDGKCTMNDLGEIIEGVTSVVKAEGGKFKFVYAS